MNVRNYRLSVLCLVASFITACGAGETAADKPTGTSSALAALPASSAPAALPPCGIEGSGVRVQDCNGTGEDQSQVPPSCVTDDPQIAVDLTGRFAYVTGTCDSDVAGKVSMYTINPTTGALTSIGPAVSTYGYGLYPGSITVDPFGKFAYVVNEGDPWGYGDGDGGNVAMYAIDTTTGALTSTGTIEANGCPGLCNPTSMVVTPSGKFAYVVTGAAGVNYGVAMYTIDATSGALTSIGFIAAAGPYLNYVAMDPTGNFVYVTADATAAPPAEDTAGSLYMYAINATTGALTSKGTIATGIHPGSVAVDPAGKFAYVTNAGSNNVSMYTIDATTGALTSIGAIAAGRYPASVAVDPAGKFAYVTNSASNDVSMYTINSTSGSLTLIGTIAAGPSPSSIAIHPSGEFAFVTDAGSNDVSTYSIGSNGTLTLETTTGT